MSHKELDLGRKASESEDVAHLAKRRKIIGGSDATEKSKYGPVTPVKSSTQSKDPQCFCSHDVTHSGETEYDT
jgi:hypothetical protein